MCIESNRTARHEKHQQQHPKEIMLLRKRRTIESTISPPKEVNIEQEQKRVVPVPNREGRQRLIYKINRATIDGNGIDGTDDDDDEDTKLAKQQMSRNQLATGKLDNQHLESWRPSCSEAA